MSWHRYCWTNRGRADAGPANYGRLMGTFGADTYLTQLIISNAADNGLAELGAYPTQLVLY